MLNRRRPEERRQSSNESFCMTSRHPEQLGLSEKITEYGHHCGPAFSRELVSLVSREVKLLSCRRRRPCGARWLPIIAVLGALFPHEVGEFERYGCSSIVLIADSPDSYKRGIQTS
ncbi:hypothetical protein MPH_11149 [Macrophomina phaseolina MS6]|uniref:Uncharacterized protein n=1 Tax=Macrophomina phaseolina (strain MS6) TaxID=1126212 RepID=K2QP04_MACPH|nr:hypothetical protein MPH_11149 [Macrophomina phaseolina MS6]